MLLAKYDGKEMMGRCYSNANLASSSLSFPVCRASSHFQKRTCS